MPTPLAARMPRLNWLSLTPSSAALLEPARRRLVVGRAVGAHRKQHRQIVHGAGVALLGGHLVPGLGLGDVAVDAEALLVEIADAVLRRGKAEFGRLLVPFRGRLHVGLHAAPFGVARADLEQRLGVAGVGCFAQRQRAGIGGHARSAAVGRGALRRLRPRRWPARGGAVAIVGARRIGCRRRGASAVAVGSAGMPATAGSATSSCGSSIGVPSAVSSGASAVGGVERPAAASRRGRLSSAGGVLPSGAGVDRAPRVRRRPAPARWAGDFAGVVEEGLAELQAGERDHDGRGGHQDRLAAGA